MSKFANHRCHRQISSPVLLPIGYLSQDRRTSVVFDLLWEIYSINMTYTALANLDWHVMNLNVFNVCVNEHIAILRKMVWTTEYGPARTGPLNLFWLPDSTRPVHQSHTESPYPELNNYFNSQNLKNLKRESLYDHIKLWNHWITARAIYIFESCQNDSLLWLAMCFRYRLIKPNRIKEMVLVEANCPW